MRPLDTILSSLATRLALLTGTLKGADPFFADTMGELPRAIVAWMATTNEFKQGIHVFIHRVDVYCVIDPRASMTRSAQETAEIVKPVVEHLYGDVHLGVPVTGLAVKGIRPATIGLGGETYVASVISLEIEDKARINIA